MSLITEKNNINSEEHILVCLSAAPSNKKIIDTATKMAEGLQARFTALYVQTGTKAEAMDKEGWKSISGMQKSWEQKS